MPDKKTVIKYIVIGIIVLIILWYVGIIRCCDKETVNESFGDNSVPDSTVFMGRRYNYT